MTANDAMNREASDDSVEMDQVVGSSNDVAI